MMKLGLLVRSQNLSAEKSPNNDLGIGKVTELSYSTATVEYFCSIGQRLEKILPLTSLSRVRLPPQTRCYIQPENQDTWIIGRIFDWDEDKSLYRIDLPDKKIALVAEQEIYVRCNLPIDDPIEILAMKGQETPYFHDRRLAFVRCLIQQGAVSRGMTGLISANIDLYPHQVEVVRRVLEDPIQRYLLADEVGLGKTIEAGAILRQYLLDEPQGRAVVIVPQYLREQWLQELENKFYLSDFLSEFADRVQVLAVEDVDRVSPNAALGFLILDTLETLFGKPGPFQVISAVQLRPEPSYWFAWCQSAEIRKQRLIEAVYHLPRPLIVYATKREDVRRWQQDLLRAGFKRCAMMTGESSTTECSQLIQDLRERRVDIVVATSAFGLGVDQSDVRAVIHACIPETIDRFYQEVGRGGRDGKAAISLALHTDEDLKIAKYLNEKSAITIERGLQRWESMFLKKEPSIDGRFRVLVNIPPSLQLADIDMNSEQNQAWNIRTLTLMSRASLIEMDADRPPLIKNFESKDAYQKAWELHRESRFIRILDESHLKKQTWEQKVEPIRQQSQNRSYKNLELMREALRSERCISEILAEAYTIGDRAIPEPRKQVIVSRACGGCPVCRKNRESIFSGIMPAPISVWQNPKLFVGKELERLLAGDKLMLIFYESMEEKSWKRKSPQVFQWLTEQGIKNLVVTREFHSTLIKEPNLIPDAFIFLFEKYQPILMPRIPTLIFHPPGKAIPEKYLSPNRTSDAPLIIVLPVDTADPSRNDRKLIDIFPGKYFMFNHFCTEVNL
ncbi:MAG: hypothetical protein JGK04_12960 [Microcoleus sp. PH2017_39_LGB_O_B]|uniref:protein DpdF n=1 Tax=unclassified Microcoleus TaxID=2642155 RepID=UPI001D5FED20|nr:MULTISPECIES: protein DpdF [unclassified Microcoleus]MCC3448524.1 hypothetical protein [Microcoleus sp. PH2017_09_SFU_O_A]MCC3629319.1 hypothetical protein [Microcoleus sp. PH2017_39_LGB_O_B]MCC3641369.1 hypothetical protein [Microcoleus sp. PH2017_33_LGB_O_A]TAF90849.1 MAG: hypothetical protein EAZ49_07680 [Oscillatoriales cyanobacterium]